jgi:hypothetical protein
MPAFEASVVVRVRRGPWFEGLAYVAFFTIIALMFWPASHESPAGRAVLFELFSRLLVYGLLGWSYYVKHSRHLRWPARGSAAQAKVDARGLQLEPGPFVARATIDQAFFVSRPNEPSYLLIRPKGGLRRHLRLEVANADEGRRLLHALGFGTSQTIARFRVISYAAINSAAGSAKARWFGAIAMISLNLTATWGVYVCHTLRSPFPVVWPHLAILTLLTLAFGVTAETPTRLHIGTDGLLLIRPFSKRFIPYARLQSAARYDGPPNQQHQCLTLTLRGGEAVRVFVSWAKGDPEIDIILQRTHEALEAWRAGGGGQTGASSLARPADISPTAWVARLRTLGVGQPATHRVSPLSREMLWQMLEDPASPPGRRAAAAVALQATLDDAARARLRVVAQTSTQPRLRAALDAVVEAQEDEAVAEALCVIEREG